MVECMMNEPPHGYNKVSIEQIRKEEMNILKKLQEMTRSGLKATGSAGRLLDALVQQVLDTAAIQMMLFPFLKGAAEAPRINQRRGYRGRPGIG